MADPILPSRHQGHNPDAKTYSFVYQDTATFIRLFQLSYEDYAQRSNLGGDFFLFYLHFLVSALAKTDRPNNLLEEHYRVYCTQLGQEIHNQLTEQSKLSQGYFESLVNLIQRFIEQFHTTTQAESVQYRYQLFLILLEFIFKNSTVLEAGLTEMVENLFLQLRQKC